MPNEQRTADVIIIGGGPGGLSAALWCAELGLETVLIERHDELGGQLHLIHNPISNYIGREASNGKEMLSHFRASIEHSGFARLLRTNVSTVDTRTMSVTSDAGEIAAQAIVVATGVRRRRLGIPGELEFSGKGILESGARDLAIVGGKRVLIVGGGDAAFENALILSEVAESVTVVFRKPTSRARNEFQVAAASRTNITLLAETRVANIVGGDSISGVELENLSTGCNWTEPVEAVLIRIGVEPNSEFVRELVACDEHGYIGVDGSCETSVRGIYAIGDVAYPRAPTIGTAAGSGAIAAKAIGSFLDKGKRP